MKIKVIGAFVLVLVLPIACITGPRPESFITGSNGIEMVWIPAGTFTRGSNNSADWEASPAYTVTLTQGFYMGKYEVTQAQWVAVMGINPSHFNGGRGREPAAGEIQGNRPVEQVSWYDAIVFCNRLSIKEGLTPAYFINNSTNPDDWGAVPASRNSTWDAVTIAADSTGYRLPTEAQWEYAARAGTTTAWSYGDTANGDFMWFSSNSNSRTHEVGKKLPNAWGLYDMHGNVWEWCWDWWGSSPSSAQTDTIDASSGSDRVSCGGSWYISAEHTHSASIGYDYPYHRGFSLGFRLVRP